jgi:hypothetical protein
MNAISDAGFKARPRVDVLLGLVGHEHQRGDAACERRAAEARGQRGRDPAGLGRRGRRGQELEPRVRSRRTNARRAPRSEA